MKKTNHNFYKYSVGAFISVEYSILISILLLIITFLVYIGFFQYNQCILTTNTYMLGIYGAEQLLIDQNNLQQHLEDKSAQLYNEKYFLTEQAEYSYYTKGSKKLLNGSVIMGNPFYGVGIGEKYWTANVVYTISDIQPTYILSIYKHIKSAVKEIKEK